jgi:hypothetical protein
MADQKLKTVTRTQGANQALKDGTVKPKTFAFDFIEVDPLIVAFRRMVRGLEFDICEMAITTYICAREHGKRMTALPIFLVRASHHGAILVNAKAGIASAKDLEGKRVGVDHLGAFRRRARGGVSAAGECRAGRKGEEDRRHAGVRGACGGNWGRGEASGREAAHSECARGRAGGAARTRALPDQPS